MSTAAARSTPSAPSAPSAPSTPSAVNAPSAPSSRDSTHLRALAWERHCQGVATADIAGELDVPARTIRSWLAATRDDLTEDLADLRQTHLLLAVDSLRRLLATTWELLEAERDATLPQLEALALRNASQTATRSRPSHAPRYITAVLAIQKELNRLLALSATTLTTPTLTEPQNAAETATSSASPATDSPLPSTIPSPHGPFPSQREGGRGLGSPSASADPTMRDVNRLFRDFDRLFANHKRIIITDPPTNWTPANRNSGKNGNDLPPALPPLAPDPADAPPA